jgi:hypothetical protein
MGSLSLYELNWSGEVKHVRFWQVEKTFKKAKTHFLNICDQICAQKIPKSAQKIPKSAQNKKSLFNKKFLNLQKNSIGRLKRKKRPISNKQKAWTD